MKTAKEIIDGLDGVLSLSQIAKLYFGKSRSWLYNKKDEAIVNGVKSEFSIDDLGRLSEALKDVANKISLASKEIAQIKETSERESGVYYTLKYNPFDHPLFMAWADMLPQSTTWLEPFAGVCSIPMMLQNMDIKPMWRCYDINPLKTTLDGFKVSKRDTIAKFPNGYKICVTNPPFLSKNSASKRKLPFPDCDFDDIYKLSLSLALANCEYVAMILPESFITSGLFQERLYGVISVPQELFFDTECPVCVALFTPDTTYDFVVYVGERLVGNYATLNQYRLNLEQYKSDTWRFNDPTGTIAVKCFDSQKGRDIRFLRGDAIPSDNIKGTSRSYTRISGLPSTIDIDLFIDRCNLTLMDYRDKTQDVFLTSYKGMRDDGCYRRRIDFGTIRHILSKVLNEMA